MTANEKLGFYITYTTGLILLSIGFYSYYKTTKFVDKAITVEGVVIQFRSKSESFYPIVEYVDHTGTERVLYSSVGSDPPNFFINEKVNVLYNPNDPKYPVHAKIDSTLNKWGGFHTFIGNGCVFYSSYFVGLAS